MAASRASTQSIQNRRFWTEFFLLYESLPALWDTTSNLYKERAAKVAGYDLMVEKLREVEENADREDVLRKINIFRTNFRREISRINMSNKMGKQYKTTLWYFNLLSFLQTQEPRRERKTTPDAEKCILPKRRLTGLGSNFLVKKQRSEEKNQSEEEQYDCDEDQNYDDYNDEDCALDQDNDNSDEEPKERHFQNQFHGFSLEQQMNAKLEQIDHEVDQYVEEIGEMEGIINEDETTEVEEEECSIGGDQETVEWSTTATMPMETQQLTAISYSPQKDEPKHKFLVRPVKNMQKAKNTTRKSRSGASEILAKSWAMQYDEMSDDQKIYARKAIADILFDGCMGNLGCSTAQHRNSRDVHEASTDDCETDGGVASGGGAVMVNGRSLLKHQTIAQEYRNVNKFEECYIFDNGQAVKIQDWNGKMK